MTAEAAFDTPNYQATSNRLAAAEPGESREDKITVITEDCSYDLKATNWQTDETNQLHLYDGDGAQPVASFATTKWVGIWKASTGATA